MKSRRWFYSLAAIGLGLFSVLIVLRLPAAAQTPLPVPGGAMPASPENGAPASFTENASVILYDQTDHPFSHADSSQNFEPALDGYDDFLVDDFGVPQGHVWRIDRVDVQGQYFNGPGPADSFNIFIYTNAITAPRSLVTSRANLTFTEAAGAFSIPLSMPIALEPGLYWLSVQANQDFTPAGQWSWTDRALTTTQSAAWQNPGGSFSKGCLTWGRRTVCLGTPAAGDQIFRLSGVSQPLVQPFVCSAGIPGNWAYRNYLPAPAYGPGAASDGVYAYAIGGYNTQSGTDLTQTVRYDPAANTWMELAPLPDARMMASAVYAPINNKLYVFGGEKHQTGQVYNTTFIYDLASNTWTSGAPMPDVRAFMGAGYANGKIYLTGGYLTTDINTVQAQTWEYDMLANTWTTKADLPEPLGGPAAAVLNGILYIIGGRDSDPTARTQTYAYNIAQNTWSARMHTPYGVNVPGAAVTADRLDGQNKIWVIGGGDPFLAQDGPAAPARVDTPETMVATLVYDPSANTWGVGPSLNMERSFVGATAVGDFVVAMGGYDGSASTDTIEVAYLCPRVFFSALAYAVNENVGATPVTVTLELAAPITATVTFSTTDGTATAGSDYLAASGKLTFPPGVISRTFTITILNDTHFEDNETVHLALGIGDNAAPVQPNPASLTILNDDPPPALACGYQAPGPWVLRNSLPQAAYGPGVAGDGLYAYVLGGYSKQSQTDLSQALRYDPLANTWTALPALPDARTMASAVYAPINHKLYVFGGEKIGTGQVYNTTFIYDTANHTWTTGASMPGVRALMGAGYASGNIYLVGGYTSPDVHTAQSQTWEYDVLANTWATKANLPQPLGGPAAAVVNGRLYVIGGRDSSTAARNQTYMYDIAQNTWSARTNAPYGINVPGAGVLQNKIWVIGGGDPFLARDALSFPADGSLPQTTNTTLIYDPAADSWTNGPALNIPRSFIGATGFGNFVLAVGGYSAGFSAGAVETAWICPNNFLPNVVNNVP